jgi:hypothetical protein
MPINSNTIVDLETVDLARLLAVRAGDGCARVGEGLARAKVVGLGAHLADLGGALVLKGHSGGVIRAVVATKGARGDILLGIALGVGTSDTTQVGLKVDKVALDVRDLGTTHKAKRIAALIRILPLLRDQYIGVGISRLLIADISTLCGTNACPVLCPEW